MRFVSLEVSVVEFLKIQEVHFINRIELVSVFKLKLGPQIPLKLRRHLKYV